jgi:hypothetical protein
MYFFQPGQKFICHRQNLPMSDFGFLSYFARIEQLSQLCSAIFYLFSERKQCGKPPLFT